MPKHFCLITQLADLLQREGQIKAILLDRAERRVTFALGPATNGLASQLAGEVSDLLREHSSGAGSSDCWNGECEECREDYPPALPKGYRIIQMPDAGVMIERETCPTGPRFWNWTEVKAPKRARKVLAVSEDTEWKHGLVLSAACLLFVLAAVSVDKFASGLPAVAIVLYLLGYVAGGWHPAEEAFGLIKKRVLDIHFLMLCVAVGAAFIGHWWEGGILLFLFSLSGALEELAEARTEREIRSLFRDAPQQATRVVDDGSEIPVAVEAIQPGMILRVRPGEQFAVDGKVLNGSTAANEANLTGESLPVEKNPGHEVFSGTLNLWGAIDYQALRSASESALAKVIRLINEARESKAPSQRFTEYFGSRYTYAILGICFLMFLLWWLVLGLPPFLGSEGEQSAFYRAMALLVVASPCALVLSIPSAVLAGIAAGARRGVLFRGGAAIEKLADATRFVFDKTGTLTTGELKVETIEGSAKMDLLGASAALAHHSAHPVSRAIARKALEEGADLGLPAENVRDLPGSGIEGAIEGRSVRLGNRPLFPMGKTKPFPPPPAGCSEVFVEHGDHFGRIVLRDELRPVARRVMRALLRKRLSVSMLTGDRPEAAALVARELAIDDVRHSLTPEGKVKAIQNWSKQGERVVMVGDGVNDAPGFAAADIAVGMGMRGADASLEQADVVLMKDRLENLLFAYGLSRRARAIIRQNLAISLGVIVLLVIIALGGHLPLTLGVVGHEGSTVIVVLNSLRLLLGNRGSGSGFDGA